MRLKDICVGCGLGIWFEKKDIKKISKKIAERFLKENKLIQAELDKIIERGFIFKKKEYAIRSIDSRELLESWMKIPVGFIKCPACGQEKLILKNA